MSGDLDSLHLSDMKVEGNLGSGATGEVYLARSLLTGEQFAVKRAHFESDDRRLAFLREYAIWTRIPPHANVVRCAFLRSTRAGVLLFSEYMPRGSLAGRQDTAEPLHLARDLACALAHLHALGLVHGDVNPGNVLFADDGRAKLGDFGGTQVCRVSESSEGVRGSRWAEQFAAPEVLAGANRTPASDLWSWAQVVFTCERAGQVPPEVTALLEHCLAREPSARPRDASELKDCLEVACPKRPGTWPSPESGWPALEVDQISELLASERTRQSLEAQVRLGEVDTVVVAEHLLENSELLERAGDTSGALYTVSEFLGRLAPEPALPSSLLGRFSLRRADLLQSVGRLNDSHSLYRTAVQHLNLPGDESTLALCLHNAGHAAWQANDLNRATQLVQRAVSIRQTLHDEDLRDPERARDLSWSVALLATIHSLADRWPEWRTAADHARRLAEAVSASGDPRDRHRLALCLADEGSTLGDQGRFAEANELLVRAIDEWTALARIGHDHSPNLGVAHTQRSGVLRRLGRIDDALSAADEGLTVLSRLVGRGMGLEHGDLLIDARRARAEILLAAGRGSEARAELLTAQRLLEDPWAIAREDVARDRVRVCAELAELLADLEETAEATDLANRAVAMAQDLGLDGITQGTTYLARSRVHLAANRFAAARDDVTAALACWESTPDYDDEDLGFDRQINRAAAHCLRGSVESVDGDCESALAAFALAASIYKALLDRGQDTWRSSLAETLLEAATTARRGSQIEGALERATRARALFEDLIGTEGRFYLMSELAEAHLIVTELLEQLGRPAEVHGGLNARSLVLTAPVSSLGPDKRLELAHTIMVLGNLAGAAGHAQLAVDYGDRAVALLEPVEAPLNAEVCGALATAASLRVALAVGLVAEQQWDAAIAAAQQAMARLQRLPELGAGDRVVLVHALQCEADARFSRGDDPPEIAPLLNQAVNAADHLVQEAPSRTHRELLRNTLADRVALLPNGDAHLADVEWALALGKALYDELPDVDGAVEYSKLWISMADLCGQTAPVRAVTACEAAISALDEARGQVGDFSRSLDAHLAFAEVALAEALVNAGRRAEALDYGPPALARLEQLAEGSDRAEERALLAAARVALSRLMAFRVDEEDWASRNERRIDLIERKLSRRLTAQEEQELSQLQNELHQRQDAEYPLPPNAIDEANRRTRPSDQA